MLDIVLLTHCQGVWLDLAIRAVEAHTRNPYRLIIVDSAATDPKTKEVIDDAYSRGHSVVRLGENRSFSNGVNAGVNAGTNKFVVILNDDALVTENWDTYLLQDASQKEVGLVGARSNYAAGAQGDPSWQGEPPFLVFVCVAFRRETWKLVGPLDEETFDGFSSEDLDYSWRVRKAGLKLKVSNAYVLHAGSRSLQNTLQTGEALRKNNEKYNLRLTEKWGKEWVTKNTQMRPRVLVASYHAEEHTRVKFLGDVIQLKSASFGTQGVGEGGGRYGFAYYQHTRTPIHMARQVVCDYATDNGFDALIQLDDDATFPNDLLPRLLSHQKDVVCALAYGRKPPHMTCVFELGDITDATPENERFNGKTLFGNAMEGIEHTGLRRVDVSGFHCSLVKTSVIRRMREGLKNPDGSVRVPGTRQYFGGFENKVGEDFAFCHNLRKYEIPLYVDTDLISGHIGDAVVIDEAYKKAFGGR